MQDSASIKSMLSLNDYYRRICFGCAAGWLNLSAEQMDECIDQSNFSAVEVPFEYWNALPGPARQKFRKRFPVIHCGNLLVPGLTSLILSAGRNIQREFVRTCSGILRSLAADGISCGALDFSLVSALQDKDKLKTVSEILRKLHPVLLETGMTLLLPVRLPLPEPSLKDALTGFLRAQMIAGLKFRLEIYPHELKPDFKPEDLAGTMRLETRSVLFCCNADTGNRLLRVHLTPWLRYFALNAYPGPFFFGPFSRNNRLAALESETCSKLIEEIGKNR